MEGLWLKKEHIQIVFQRDYFIFIIKPETIYVGMVHSQCRALNCSLKVMNIFAFFGKGLDSAMHL